MAIVSEPKDLTKNMRWNRAIFQNSVCSIAFTKLLTYVGMQQFVERLNGLQLFLQLRLKIETGHFEVLPPELTGIVESFVRE